MPSDSLRASASATKHITCYAINHNQVILNADTLSLSGPQRDAEKSLQSRDGFQTLVQNTGKVIYRRMSNACMTAVPDAVSDTASVCYLTQYLFEAGILQGSAYQCIFGNPSLIPSPMSKQFFMKGKQLKHGQFMSSIINRQPLGSLEG